MTMIICPCWMISLKGLLFDVLICFDYVEPPIVTCDHPNELETDVEQIESLDIHENVTFIQRLRENVTSLKIETVLY